MGNGGGIGGGAVQSAQSKRVIVLGGGAAGVAAAFWLSSPQLNGKYQVTLYSQGWRLGGKCASGRNLAVGKRIEEHGLHMLMGCYENAFRTIRACYDEWQPQAGAPFRQWDQAFTPQRQITLMELDGPGTPPSWAPWNFNFPQLPGQPGDGSAFALVAAQPAPRSRDQAMAIRLADWLEGHLSDRLPSDLVPDFRRACEVFRKAAMGPSAAQTPVVTAQLKQVNARIGQRLENRGNRNAGALRAQEALNLESEWARFLILANLGLAAALGFTVDILPHWPHLNVGIDLLNARDFRDWLKSHGAKDMALASAPIRAIYDLTFAFPGGDASRIENGAIAAGVTLRFASEMSLGYRNAPLWKMSAGMGDTVFTPFYQVLQARGVDIRLFSRIEALALAADGTLGAVTIAQQAAIVGGGAYQPFVTINGLQCWPDEPDWSQLVNGAKLHASGVDFEYSGDDTKVGEQTLQPGVDFDIAILAMPPAVIKVVGQDLLSGNAAWQKAIAGSASVATQSLQVWMRPTLAELGWPLGPTVMSAYAEPYDSYADMSHLLAAEEWTGPTPPRSIGYFCGCFQLPAMGPPDPPSIEQAGVQEANTWLSDSIGALWPNALAGGGTFNNDLVVSRYDRVNFDLSELYVQTPPAGVQNRLSSTGAYFGKLYVAGDWTLTRFSGGCFESAIESGMLAAAAISGWPTNIVTT